MKKAFILLTGILLFIGSLSAQTPISGTISGTLTAGDYQATGNLTVSGTLTINPGVTIYFNQNTAMLVTGTLNAIGTVTDSIKFVKHSSATDWNGLYFYNASNDNNLFEYCRFSQAAADTGRGGAIAIYSSSPDFNNCVFSDNTTVLWGGGVCVIAGASTFTNCVFSGNTASFGGGFYCRDNSNVTLTNCLIVDNTAGVGGGYGGGVRVYAGSTANLYNCTIAGNICVGAPLMGSFQVQSAGTTNNTTLNIYNSIVWGNSSGTGYQKTWSATNGTVNFYYTDVEDAAPWNTNGCFTEDPLFVGGFDWHLLPGSRCIDAGNPAASYSNEPLPNGGRLNIGYYGNTAGATVSQVTLPIPRDIYTLTGVPVQVTTGDPIALFADDFANATPGWPWWRVSRWDIFNATYIRFGEPDYPVELGLNPLPFVPGMGYWVVENVVDDCVLDIVESQIDLGAVNQQVYYGVPIEGPQNAHAGMNMLANPYPYEYDWRNTMITDGNDTLSLTDAALALWVNPYAAIWLPSSKQYQVINFTGSTPPYMIPVWGGFLFQQIDPLAELELLFEPRWFTEGGSGIQDLQDETEGWGLQLSVNSVNGELNDWFNTAGVNEISADDYDLFDAIEYTPQGESFVQLFFEHFEWGMNEPYFTYDYRSMDFAEPKVWDFSVGVYNSPNTQFNLNWPNLGEISEEYSFRLEDLTNGTVVADMRSAGEYGFTTGSAIADVVNFRMTVTYTEASVGDNGGLMVTEFGLASAYPNPFNAQTRISYNLQMDENVSLKVFDTLGRQIAVLSEGYQNAGSHSVDWNAKDVSSGVYFVRLESAGKSYIKKLILLK